MDEWAMGSLSHSVSGKKETISGKIIYGGIWNEKKNKLMKTWAKMKSVGMDRNSHI